MRLFVACVLFEGVVSALLSVTNWAMKSVLLRFIEQIWGTVPLAVTPAVGVLDLTPVGRLTAKPATAMSPIALHLMEVWPCEQRFGLGLPLCLSLLCVRA